MQQRIIVQSHPLIGGEDSFEHPTSFYPSQIIEQQQDGNHLSPSKNTTAEPPGLQRTSVVDVLGADSLQRATVVRVSPSVSTTPSTPRPAYPIISIPHKEFDTLQKLSKKSLWRRFLEFTPGTNAHQEKFGTRWTLGGFRMAYGRKRGNM